MSEQPVVYTLPVLPLKSAVLFPYLLMPLSAGRPASIAAVEAAMAKMTATETAQQVIDSAVQILGGLGVVSDEVVETLYREIRPLRIYEGATEVQQLIIARGVIQAFLEKGNSA